MTSPPPSNWPPDHDVGPVLVWITVALSIIAITLVSLRFYVRRTMFKLASDDWTMLIALLIANSRMIFQILQLTEGNGRHRVYLTAEQYIRSNKWGWYAQLGLFGGMCFCKISICLLILRIKSDRFLRRLMGCVIGGLVLTNGTFVIILLAECQPLYAYWRPNAGHCWTSKARIYTAYCAVGYGVLTDLLVSLLPLYIVWSVQIPWKTKLSVCGLMSLGLIATGFGIMRAASLGIKTTDLTWDYCIVAIWSNLELFIAIITANLALSRSILLHFFPKHPSRETSMMPPPYYGTASGGPQSASTRRANSQPQRIRNLFDLSLGSTLNSTQLTGHGSAAPTNIHITSDCRRASSSQSVAGSEIPLEPHIRKKTEFYVQEEDEDGSTSSEGAMHIEGGGDEQKAVRPSKNYEV